MISRSNVFTDIYVMLMVEINNLYALELFFFNFAMLLFNKYVYELYYQKVENLFIAEVFRVSFNNEKHLAIELLHANF